MANPITALTDLAMSWYQAARSSSQPIASWLSSGDAVLDGITLGNPMESIDPAESLEAVLDRAVQTLRAESVLAPFTSREENDGVMIMYDGGGARASFRSIIESLLICAARQLYILRTDLNEASFVGKVLENYGELRRAAQGEQVRVYKITGFSGIKLGQGARVETPWGAFHAAPGNPRFVVSYRYNLPETTAILVKEQLKSITISGESQPEIPPPDEDQAIRAQRVRQLLPLSFALVTVHSNLCAPLATFESAILPFSSAIGYSRIPWFFPTNRFPVEPTSEQLIEVEVWSRRLDQHFAENLEITGRRIVSAIAQRADPTDSLVDAVTAWESMVGTGNETSFRVTAALARLLERDSSKRLEFQKELRDIYGLRSRAVHGDSRNPTDVANGSKRAIEIGLKALNAIYSRSGDWLTMKSEERANRLILEE